MGRSTVGWRGFMAVNGRVGGRNLGIGIKEVLAALDRHFGTGHRPVSRAAQHEVLHANRDFPEPLVHPVSQRVGKRVFPHRDRIFTFTI